MKRRHFVESLLAYPVIANCAPSDISPTVRLIVPNDDLSDSRSITKWLEIDISPTFRNRLTTLHRLLHEHRMESLSTIVDARWELLDGWSHRETTMEVSNEFLTFTTIHSSKNAPWVVERGLVSCSFTSTPIHFGHYPKVSDGQDYVPFAGVICHFGIGTELAILESYRLEERLRRLFVQDVTTSLQKRGLPKLRINENVFEI